MYMIVSKNKIVEQCDGDLRSAQAKASELAASTNVEATVWQFKGKIVPKQVMEWSEK